MTSVREGGGATEEATPDKRGINVGMHMSFAYVTSILLIVALLVIVLAFVIYHCIVQCRRMKNTVVGA